MINNNPSNLIESKEVLVLNQLHSAQQEINNLRLLNVCLQSTLLRVQTQLIEYLPENFPDEIKRHETQQKLAFIRQTDDHSKRIIHSQQFSFFENFKNFFDNKQEQSKKSIPLTKNEKQIDILFELFQELNTIIHTEHNDRICQLYITLAQTSQSVNKTQEVLENTIHVHKIITKKKFKRKVLFICLIFTFITIILLFIILSIRKH